MALPKMHATCQSSARPAKTGDLTVTLTQLPPDLNELLDYARTRHALDVERARVMRRFVIDLQLKGFHRSEFRPEFRKLRSRKLLPAAGVWTPRHTSASILYSPFVRHCPVIFAAGIEPDL